jgi:hypothetical protein
MLAGATCAASSKFTFIITSSGGLLNPLHDGKSTYRWIAPSAEVMEKWVDAITAAAGAPMTGADAAEVCAALFRSPRTIVEYVDVVNEVASRGSYVRGHARVRACCGVSFLARPRAQAAVRFGRLGSD